MLQNEKWRFKKLESLQLYFDKQERTDYGIFYFIEPYTVKKYKGRMEEKQGQLTLSHWELLEQIPCHTIEPPPTIGKQYKFPKNPIEVIEKDTQTEAYIVDTLESANYYQEKDENGFYGTCLETTSYFRIGQKEEQKTVAKIYQLNLKNVINK